jgi:long-chain acyl-CoA synthetase
MSGAFWEWAEERPDHPAVIGPDGRTTSYSDLCARVNRFSHAIRSAGVTPTERIAAMLANNDSYFVVALGAQQVGVHLVPLNTHLSADEVAYIIRDSQPRMLLVDESLADLGRAAADAAEVPLEQRIGIEAIGDWRSLSHLIDDEPATLPDSRVFAQIMLYTSGTTGRPKGVVYPVALGRTPEESIAAVDPLMRRRGMWTDPDAVSLVTGPLYHGAPGAWGLQGLHHGHTIVLLDKWDSEGVLQLVEKHRVTTAQMAPIHFHRLLALPDEVRARYDVSSLQVVSHAGAACPVETKQRMMDWLGPVLYEYYASSEGYGTSITPQEWLEHPGSVGRADADGAQMKVLDDDGNELGPDEVGTLWIRNPGGILSSYLNDEAKTEASHRDGFYTAGDQARIDNDGWVYIVDRRTDLILSGGVNIYPAEVERALADHPAVADVAVVGRADPEWGKRVHAVVVPAVGVTPGPDLEADIRAHAEQSLARFKLPRTIEFRDSLPYSPTGKLLRRLLVDDPAPV